VALPWANRVGESGGSRLGPPLQKRLLTAPEGHTPKLL
jgi:hypothetical protein